MTALAAAGPSPFWFLTRGTGAVSLVLLTVTVALGIANVRRTQLAHLPRFVTDAVHRSASLLAVSFLLVHIATALADGFAPINLLDVVIPFGAAYRPLWLGFGALALDLILAVTVTSLLRRRLGYGAWRATHWAAYASWPIALLHGLGTGSDTKTHWMLLLSAACTAIVVLAVIVRVSTGWPEHAGRRLAALGLAGVIPLGVLAWLPRGPLGAHWARQAGTPAALLSSARPATVTYASAETAASRSGGAEQGEHEGAFRSAVTGEVHRSVLAGAQRGVEIALRVPGQPLGELEIRIQGPAEPGGGVQMASSRVTLGPASDPGQYSGHVTALEGQRITARVANPGYATLTLLADLSLDPSGSSATGTLTATTAEGAH